MAPDATELVFWTTPDHATNARIDEARRELAVAFGAPDGTNWRTTLEHLRDGGRYDRALIDALRADPPRAGGRVGARDGEPA